VQTPSQPLMFIGYKRPSQYHKDDPVFDVITMILASGRTGILYKEMVRDKKLSLAAVTAPAFPGAKYPNLFLFFLVPALGKTVEENETEFYAIVDRFKDEKVDDATLARVKTKARAGLIRQLDNNAGLAQLLTLYHAAYGDWRKLFTAIDDVNKVTADDVQRVAREYFVPQARTVAYTVQPARRRGAAR
jgi:predicted Zn-dependent peptidase